MPKISDLTAASSVATTDLIPVVQTVGAVNNPKKATFAQMIASVFTNAGANVLALVNGGTGSSTAAGARTNLAVPSTSEIQNQTQVAYTTAGSGTAYTITPSPAISAYTASQSFWVTFHTVSGAAPTLTINGIGTPPNLVRQLSDGTFSNIAAGEIPTNHRSKVTLISATQALVEELPYASGSKIGMQVFSTPGTATYTPTAGTRWIEVEVQAPGGGSGGAVATTAGQFAAGLPGGGGGYGRKKITSGFAGTTVTIGAAGTAGAAGSNAGGNGGTTSFGAFLSCTGGAGGIGGGLNTSLPSIQANVSNAAGGTATGADFSRPGSTPNMPFTLNTTQGIRPPGGDAYLGAGGGGSAIVSNNAAAAAGTGYGGGASGPFNVNGSFAAIAGAAGAPGIVIVHEYA